MKKKVMKNRYKLLFLFALLLGATTVQSQEYLEMIDAETFSVEEIRTNAEAYFLNKDKGRGSGYVQYKRWEYNAMRLMNENGYLPTTTENIAEWERYNAYLNETAGNRQFTNDNWTELGPTYWNQTSGWNPGVGRITGISIDKTNNDHIIISARSGGVWKTTDDGTNWTALNDNFSNMSFFSVTIDPSNSSVYYAGANSGMIFNSTDSGATWNLLGDVGSSTVNKILVHPTNSNTMFATSDGTGIFKSVDGGVTWSSAVADSRGYDIAFSPGNPSVVFASGLGFHKSIDGGATFTTIGGFGSGPKMIGVPSANTANVYVLEATAISGGTFAGFYSSNDTGDSFTKLNHGTNNYFGYSTTAQDNSGQAARDMGIAVNPTNDLEVHIAGILTWRSMDGGVTFTCTSDWIPDEAATANIGYCHADVDLLLFEGTTLYAGTDGGIFKATDTGTVNANYYTDITSGLGIRQFYKIGISQGLDVVVSGGSQDNGTSTYAVATGWRDWLGADGMESFIDKDDSNIMYGTSQGGQLYRTDDNANNRNSLEEPGQGSGEWVTPFEQDPSNPNTIYVGYNIIYKSTDKGVNWTSISQNFGDDLDHLKIAPSNNLIMYAANESAFFKTVDGGATNWTTRALPGGDDVKSIAIHPTDPNKVAVASSAGDKVYVSNNGGVTWINYKKNLPNFSSLAVVWDDNGVDALYVGMNYGIFYIDNNLTDWLPYSNNLPNVQIRELEINSTQNKLYAATFGRGLWSSDVQDSNLGITSVVSADNVQVYPNPATTEITVSLTSPSEVDIRIFDVSGKLLVYQADKMIEGTHSLDVSELTSGVYFLRINSENGEITKKLIKN
jgi:photosystem II stability/assembly factor-like uncharacterized protein